MSIEAGSQEPSCLLCGGALSPVLEGLADTRLGVPGKYEISRCGECGLEQTLPRPAPTELRELYETFYNFGGSRDSVYTRLRQAFHSSVFYRTWLAIDGDISFHKRRGEGRLLDIGCNEGRGLERYRAAGFQVEGLELNAVAAEEARARGFRVSTVELAEFYPDKTYDVAVISNVLEHSLDSRAMLAAIHRILGPGGQVWISCPNAESWLRGLFGRAWINWHVPFHIVHFSRDALTDLLRRAGFELQEARQETPALWVAHSVIARLFARPDRPTKQLHNPFLVASLMLLIRSTMFPLLWLGNRFGRGDCLIAVARKA